MHKLGIDATNLSDGGGLTHLLELIGHADPQRFDFDSIVVWGGENLDKIDDQSWLTKQVVIRPSDPYWKRTSWSSRNLNQEFSRHDCSLLFAPGGSFASKQIPYVSMSQNMLLYDDKERRRFPWGWNRIRYNVLRHAQRRSFLHSVGNVFISHYAFDQISKRFPFVASKPNTIIYHGVNDRFSAARRGPNRESDRLRLLYVSRINYYKHQWNVIEAVKRLNARGFRIQLRLVGADMPKLSHKVSGAINGSSSESVVLTGQIPYEQIEQEYLAADAFVFASTCENMPNILVEAMSAGLPIACSNYGPMPEILGDSGIYFDPISVDSTEKAIERIAASQETRRQLVQQSLKRAQQYSWQTTADQTLQFLQQCLTRTNTGADQGDSK